MERSQEMQSTIKAIFGQTPEEAITTRTCVKAPLGCGKPITGFKDSLSAREYQISGFCQECQDKVFGADDDD
jgi:hypothetical protein